MVSERINGDAARILTSLCYLFLEIKIGKIMYAGELGQTTAVSREEQLGSMGTSTLKKVYFEDVSVSTDEFSFSKGADPLASMLITRSMSRHSSGGQDKESESSEEEPDPPLPMAALIGKQELVLKFQELNQYGLPRAIEEIELSLGGLMLHLYPHQIHTLTEIISALSVPKPEDLEEDHREQFIKRHKEKVSKNLESLLQKSMYQGSSGFAQKGWSNHDQMDMSCDFQPALSGPLGTSGGSLEGSFGNVPPPEIKPRILIKLVSLSAVILERDLNVAKLGGESTKSLAMTAMRAAAFNYFTGDFKVGFAANESANRLDSLHKEMLDHCRTSNVAIAATMIQLVHEEGSTISSTAGKDVSMFVNVSARQLSVKEVLYDDPLSDDPTEIVDLLKFENR